MSLDTISAIVDEDLLAELEKFENTPGYTVMQRALAQSQAKRNRERAALADLPREKRRRADTAKFLASGEPDPQDIRHMHSVLAICGLPYERLPIEQRDFSRKQGNMALDITSGILRDERGVPHVQPIPFGPKARLVLMHLCSEAIRQKAATIEIADSLTGFVRDMGFSDSAGKRGPMTAFKEQLNAMAAASMRISVWEDNRVRTRNITPIDQMDLWLPSNPDQRSLWPSTVTFSDAMFKSIQQRSMPLNRHVIKALAGSARKLDLYFWMNWRMHNLTAPLSLGWDSLYDQFGGGSNNPRRFKQHFKDDLADIREILTRLPAKLTDKGLTILPADPDVLALPVARSATSKKS
jgi:hypothetical protein